MKTYTPFSQIEARRHGMIELCESINPEYLVTLRFNNHRAHNLDRAETVLKRFDAALDRKLLGRDWANLGDELRTRFIAIPEGHSSGNPYT
jgi:hypothetical protein